ncbi:alpha/beta fold hydrolase [Paracoccus sp. 1_MG-2023]|uniref:alpha/beta fold hydrolase n=1 Tax=unclassified Paracoccus (in: a-proteobacteria) TaxID=2688777 RepID=UPI001C099AC9|nr:MULTISPECIES: alpha/beta fold hydrolase [unclassified Paracoccus (in: a-proteobacteria)]MBU2959018.1 alpha/beta fold hydrolase [Paracoccus sp. C2R09]MDO6668990.1 alpha/beta fold hydrolase [Paracoccus sp. 1_MG-2023]
MAVMRADAGTEPDEALLQAARALPRGAPIVVMSHGFRYSPDHPAHCPHRHILSPTPPSCGPSWPLALGFGGPRSEGLAVAFGWQARGRLRAAYGRAEQAGCALGDLVGRLSALAERPVALIGHSLGGRVVLQATARATPGSVGRVVLLNAAEFRDMAAKVVATPSGRRAEFLNVTARENDPFDFALEAILSGGRRRALGFGLETPRANWLDLQIDDAATLDALADLGFPTERGARRLSHWTSYRRGGLFEFYRAAMCHPWAVPLGLLRHHLPVRPEPRWARLWAAQGPVARA